MRARLTRMRRSPGRFLGQLIIEKCTVVFCVSLLGARQPKKLNFTFFRVSLIFGCTATAEIVSVTVPLLSSGRHTNFYLIIRSSTHQ